MIYFDHNATSPLSPAARQAWLNASAALIGNPSSPHRIGGRASTALDTAREQVAGQIGAHPLDIVFTSGATEANNLALHHFLQAAPAKLEAWISSLEHPSVLAPAQKLFGRRLREIPATPDGIADIHWLAARLKKNRPAFVALMAANNETGVLQPWAEAASLCRSLGVPFFCDATQWLGKMPAQKIGACDFVSGSAHKFGGPRGVGFLKVPSGSRFYPQLFGGSQEEGRRAGTENVPGILALAAALSAREKETDQARGRRARWRDQFELEVLTRLAGSRVLGAGRNRLWNTSSILLPPSDCRLRWVVKLDKAGFAASTGSACASGNEAPSHVLSAMGIKPEAAGRVLRFSSGWDTTAADWKTLLEGLLQVAGEMSVPIRS